MKSENVQTMAETMPAKATLAISKSLSMDAILAESRGRFLADVGFHCLSM
jgi:hypothetical protein